VYSIEGFFPMPKIKHFLHNSSKGFKMTFLEILWIDMVFNLAGYPASFSIQYPAGYKRAGLSVLISGVSLHQTWKHCWRYVIFIMDPIIFFPVTSSCFFLLTIPCSKLLSNFVANLSRYKQTHAVPYELTLFCMAGGWFTQHIFKSVPNKNVLV
jgi:hypothetical protein